MEPEYRNTALVELSLALSFFTGLGAQLLTSASNPENLAALLLSTFGFAGFRANQEAVCRAAIAGKDLLLVMPTGSGSPCATSCLQSHWAERHW